LAIKKATWRAFVVSGFLGHWPRNAHGKQSRTTLQNLLALRPPIVQSDPLECSRLRAEPMQWL